LLASSEQFYSADEDYTESVTILLHGFVCLSNIILKNSPESMSEQGLFKNFLRMPQIPSCSIFCMFGCVLCTQMSLSQSGAADHELTQSCGGTIN